MLPKVCDDADTITADVSKEDLLEAYALEICGIAFTTNIPSVLVNSFGPIAYCKSSLTPNYSFPASPIISILTMQIFLGGKFIRSEATRQEVIRRLSACKRSVGWPVERLMSSLKDTWAAELESPSFSGEADLGSGS